MCVCGERLSVCATGLSQRTDDAKQNAQHLGWVESVEVCFMSVCVERKKLLSYPKYFLFLVWFIVYGSYDNDIHCDVR